MDVCIINNNMVPVSDCCLAPVKIKKRYTVAENMVIAEGDNPNYCSKCGKDCEMIPEPRN